MPEGLKLLMVEDSEDDAEIIRMELERGGYVLDWTRVETEESFAQALEKSWDLVICISERCLTVCEHLPCSRSMAVTHHSSLSREL
ncbi:MAG: response regulator [Myxococcota bacterium]